MMVKLEQQYGKVVLLKNITYEIHYSKGYNSLTSYEGFDIHVKLIVFFKCHRDIGVIR